MAGYIGSKAAVVSSGYPTGAERKNTFAITGTTTVLAGLSYTPNFTHVYQSGVRLVAGTDYTATDGTTITLTVAAENGDEIVVISYATFQVADAYTKSEADSAFVSDPNGAITIDASENVGIGATTVDSQLHIEKSDITAYNGSATDGQLSAGATAFVQQTGGSNNALSQIVFQPRNGFGYNRIVNSGGSAPYMALTTNNAERMRLSSSGSVLVGKTADTYGIEGFSIRGTPVSTQSIATFTRDGDNVAAFNRLTSNGSILAFAKDGTTVGSIGSRTAGTLDSSYIQFYAGSSNSVGLGGTTSLAVLPILNGAASDNLIDMGVFSVRFDDIYATNGTIQTSDRNEKEAIASLTPAEMLVAARLSSSFKNFKWKDSVAEKGLDAARMHSGIIAQDVQDAFAAEGLDASDYAMFISGTWWETQTDVPAVEAVAEVVDEEGNVVTEAVEAKEAYTRTDTYHTLEEAPEGATERTRLGVRYPELLAFVAAYSDQRFISIETRLAALEATP